MINELTDAQCNEFRRHNGDFNSMVRAIFTAGCAQRQAGQEPVAQVCDFEVIEDDDGRLLHYALLSPLHPLKYGTKLYAAPQPADQPAVKRKPLTNAEIQNINAKTVLNWHESDRSMDGWRMLARAVEAAHGITATQGATQ